MPELEHITEKIKDAELVLIGLGEELDRMDDVVKGRHYQELAGKVKVSWALPFVKMVLLEEDVKESDLRRRRTDIFRWLSVCLEHKNYFVVSLCRDGLIRESGLDKGRIVEPCGGYEKLQCNEGCSAELYDVPQELREQIREFAEHGCGVEKWREPLCPACGSPLVFNNTDAASYVEEGYLKQWQIYRKWLQGTLNKKVCILELGVGMKYPTVIRWPFEKIVFFNQKAELFRIHDRLFQIPEEIKDRGCGISQKPEEVLRELAEIFQTGCRESRQDIGCLC